MRKLCIHEDTKACYWHYATPNILLVDVLTRFTGVTKAAESGRRNVMSGHELFRELLTSLYLGSLSTGAKTGDS